MKGKPISSEVKEQIINRIKNDGVSVIQASKEHGIHEKTIYGWIAKKVEGQPTLSENIKLKRDEVIKTVKNGFPLNMLAPRNDRCPQVP